MNATIQAVDVRKEAGQWLKALMLSGLILVLMMVAFDAYASEGKEFDVAIAKWESWVKGQLGKLAALIAIGVGAVVAAVKKDWSWFFGAVVLSMGVGVIVSIVNVSFTAVI